MTVGGVIFLAIMYLCLGAVGYWGAGNWGWSKKLRILYGLSGIIGMMHFLYYTGIKSYLSPSEDPIKHFKKNSPAYKKWARLKPNRRADVVVVSFMVWGTLAVLVALIYRFCSPTLGIITAEIAFCMGIVGVRCLVLRA